MIEITVELLGIARRLAGAKQITLALTEHATHLDVLRRLSELAPALLGSVIDSQTYELLPAYMLHMNGRRVVNDLRLPVEAGECLALMFVESGG